MIARDYTRYIIMDKVMEAEALGKAVLRIFIHPADLRMMIECGAPNWDDIKTLREEGAVYIFGIKVVHNAQIERGTLLMVVSTPIRIPVMLHRPPTATNVKG